MDIKGAVGYMVRSYVFVRYMNLYYACFLNGYFDVTMHF